MKVPSVYVFLDFSDNISRHLAMVHHLECFPIGRSVVLDLSIWTPWKDIFVWLPKRIHVKLLATKDMEKYSGNPARSPRSPRW